MAHMPEMIFEFHSILQKKYLISQFFQMFWIEKLG